MESKILISLKSRSPEYKIPETPILVPTNLKRFGLSEIVNHCLGNEDALIPFDFLIQNQILKSNLEDYLVRNSLSREITIDIEYIRSILPPKLSKSVSHDDWISCIDVDDDHKVIASGCYDKLGRILDYSGNVLLELKGHLKPIKSILFINKGSKDWTCITGGQDSKVLAHQKDQSILFECKGNASIESLAELSSLNMFAAGDSLGNISIFKNFGQEAIDSSDKSRNSKKAKLDTKIRPTNKSISDLSQHLGIVSCLEFSNTTKRLFSGGHDHSLRVWDIETASNLSTVNCQVPFTSLNCSKDSNLIVSGHTDNVIRFWDSRSNGKTLKIDYLDIVMKSKFMGHDNWISSVGWSPSSVFNFASASFDGCVKMWDIRSNSSMFNCHSSQEKYFAMHWAKSFIVAGGQSQKLEFLTDEI